MHATAVAYRRASSKDRNGVVTTPQESSCHVVNLPHQQQTAVAQRKAFFVVATELNTENCSKTNFFHVEIIYILIISFAIFNGNLKQIRVEKNVGR
jgi:hypothetical protein